MKLLLALLVAAPLTLAGCSQQEGDRCNVTDDCDVGLQCIYPPNGSALTGGVCTSTSNLDLGLADMTNENG